jgi:hypothetical protein
VPNWKEFRFKIEGQINGTEWSPLTLPMARLAEYITDLALIMGHKESVHFIKVEEGSHESVLFIDEEEEGRITHQTQSAARGAGPREANAAYKRLDDRLREDEAIGSITNLSRKAKVLEFPGRNLDLPQEYGPIKENTSLVGVLKRVGGFDKSVPIHLQRADEVIFYCDADELVAKQLAPYYSQTIRVHGRATYVRGKEGMWKLDHFKIQSFDPKPLSDDSFSQTIEKLKAIPGNEWSQVTDPLEELHKLRHGEDGREP